MWKLACTAMLVLLVGCGQTEVTAPTVQQPANQADNAQTKHDNEQPNMDTESKQVRSKAIYEDVFDEPVDPVTPKTLTIDKIGVNASVEQVGEADNGEMDVPKDYHNLGWFEPGTKPGEQGNSVIDGHVNDPEGKGVFWDLKQLEPGDEVTITGENNDTLVFTVTDKQTFDLGEAPVRQIFGYTSQRALNLITCTGDYNYDKGTHNQRLVVYTELKQD